MSFLVLKLALEWDGEWGFLRVSVSIRFWLIVMLLYGLVVFLAFSFKESIFKGGTTSFLDLRRESVLRAGSRLIWEIKVLLSYFFSVWE